MKDGDAGDRGSMQFHCSEDQRSYSIHRYEVCLICLLEVDVESANKSDVVCPNQQFGNHPTRTNEAAPPLDAVLYSMPSFLFPFSSLSELNDMAASSK